MDHDEFDGRLTRRLAHRLVVDAQVMPIRAVARRHLVSWAQVMTLVRAWSPLIAARRRSQRCEVLLVDETSMRKRHRYVTVIVNGDTGHTLAMVEHRSSAGLTGFLMSQPHNWRRSVKAVVSDQPNTSNPKSHVNAQGQNKRWQYSWTTTSSAIFNYSRMDGLPTTSMTACQNNC
ncbi:MAG: transposase [Acidimicrobiaceae bacterium]|nr:transposase [Acidimicrobiaceae bacterium]